MIANYYPMADVANKLPKELIINYKTHARKSSSVIAHLKVAAALKLWEARGFRDIKFDVPLAFGGKTVFVKVLARDAEGIVVGVECASRVKLGQMRERIAQLRRCLPPDSWLVVIFPSRVNKRVKEVVKLADEVWITGKNSTVECMMFMAVFQRRMYTENPVK